MPGLAAYWVKVTNTISLQTDIQSIQAALADKDWRSALSCCEQGLINWPDSPDLLYLKGIAAVQAQRFQVGVFYIQQALSLRPDKAWYFTLGKIRMDLGQSEAALEHFDSALRLNPKMIRAYQQKGRLQLKLKQVELAKANFEKVLALEPWHKQAHYQLAVIAHKDNDLLSAQQRLERLIKKYRRFELAYCLLGKVYQAQGNLHLAEKTWLQVCKSKANIVALRALFELARQKQDHEKSLYYAKALIRSEQATLADLEVIDGFLLLEFPKAEQQYKLNLILALAYLQKQQLHAAEAILLRLLRVNSEDVLLYQTLGNIYLQNGQIEAAQRAYDEVINLAPDHAGAHHNRSITFFLQNKLQAGFADYEWRLHHPQVQAHRAMCLPSWNRERLEGKTLLVFEEPLKGFGDTLKFARYLPLLAYFKGKIIVESRQTLKPLLEAIPGVFQVLTPSQPLPAIDYQVPLLSLPHVLKTTQDCIPDQFPYLAVPPAYGDRAIVPTQQFKVGIVWASAPVMWSAETRQLYLQKTAPLEAFLSLLTLTDIHLYSFQVGAHELDLHPYLCHDRLTNLAPDLHDFADTAAYLAQMDLIISVDTAVVHLAGALNLPVWVLIHSVPYWFWQPQRSSSDWYPSLRIYQQDKPANWFGLLAQIKSDLSRIV